MTIHIIVIIVIIMSQGSKNIHEKSIQIKNYIKYIITAENI